MRRISSKATRLPSYFVFHSYPIIILSKYLPSDVNVRGRKKGAVRHGPEPVTPPNQR
jgi:hypothetical protein